MARVADGPPRRDTAQTSVSGSVEAVLHLQRSAGNRAVSAWLQREAATTAAPKPLEATKTDEAKKAEEAKKEADAKKLELEEATKEFELIKSVISDADAAAYLKRRTEFFGSTEEYNKFAVDADKELTPELSKLIEQTGEVQKIFYRWIRKAYHKQGITDVPALIKKGGTAEFATALGKVKTAYPALKSEGFNPRPARIGGKHTLSALSEHATGKAVDITPQTANPQLTTSQWDFILKKAGKTVDRDKLKTAWAGDKEKAKEVWQTIKDVNDAFVKNVKEEVDKITEARAAAAKAAAAATAADAKAGEAKPESKPAGTKPAEKLLEPLDEVFKDQPALKAYKDGFFTLEWTLVEAMHANGFNWGALFGSNIDLHHFELK